MGEIVLLVAATWRVTSLLVNEDGPFDLFMRFREWAGVYYPLNESNQPVYPLGHLLSCFYCTSVWVAVLCLILLKSHLSVILLVFAISTGAIILEKITGVDVSWTK